MEHVAISQDIKNYLLPLGNSKEEIAASFKALHLRGSAKPSKTNVIAQYLQRQWPEAWCGKGMINCGLGQYIFYASELGMVALQDFAEALFNGEYQELVS